MERTILWLPGWGMSEQCWSSIHALLPLCRHIAPDFSRVEGPEEFYEAVDKAVSGVDVRSLLVVGWSMGGMLAIRLASVYPVAGLVLIGSTARFVRARDEREKGWREALLLRMKHLLPLERKRVMTDFVERMLTETDRELAAGLPEHILSSSEWSLQALAAGLAYLCEEDCRPLLSSLACPTLVIHGTEDVICPLAAGEELASLIPGASLLPIVGCGHAPPVSYPDVISEAIKRMVEMDGELSRQQSF
ncbi:alpha/beta fold hydrolase [Brevibacillus reuszeri]|uniref:alpha/beta fold hydrolase n=1 Tax=Brevibacillus reuszeri TaxID=54915 RepID=UPI00366F8E8F